MSTNLTRFTAAQDPIYRRVRGELRDGQKRSHWMWFVFPQIAGLGFSEMSRRYAISDIEEAREYFRHPVLGRRLIECTALVLSCKGRSAHDIFGSPDDLKLKSCMTLFEKVAPPNSVFASVLDHFYDGKRDSRTLELLAMDPSDLDDEFPLGDGTADTSTYVTCPYCSETVEISIDPGGGSAQDYVEDCTVCCNPWQVTVHFSDGIASVEVSPLDA